MRSEERPVKRAVHWAEESGVQTGSQIQFDCQQAHSKISFGLRHGASACQRTTEAVAEVVADEAGARIWAFMCVLRVYEWLGRKICTQKQIVNGSSHTIIGMVGSHSREGKGKIDARGMGRCRDVGKVVWVVV